MSDTKSDKSLTGSKGMSTLDLLGGTIAVNRVVKFMLHKNRMTYQELCAAVDALPPDKRMSREDLKAALDELIDRAWLGKSDQDGDTLYEVVLRPKVSSAEQLHTENLPKIDVAVEKDVNPQISSDMGKKSGLMDSLKGLFSIKK